MDDTQAWMLEFDKDKARAAGTVRIGLSSKRLRGAAMESRVTPSLDENIIPYLFVVVVVLRGR